MPGHNSGAGDEGLATLKRSERDANMFEQFVGLFRRHFFNRSLTPLRIFSLLSLSLSLELGERLKQNELDSKIDR